MISFFSAGFLAIGEKTFLVPVLVAVADGFFTGDLLVVVFEAGFFTGGFFAVEVLLFPMVPGAVFPAGLGGDDGLATGCDELVLSVDVDFSLSSDVFCNLFFSGVSIFNIVI